MHRIAFKFRTPQLALADMAKSMFADRLPAFNDSPVFITSLPRAGTTLLLEILSESPDLASHTYRNMPFVLCPMLWDRLSANMRADSQMRERAHGDGMQVGFDSPEAFEEIVWATFWKKKYGSDRIATWSADERDEEFEDFFSDHMNKIRALRGTDGVPCARYVSKNNANIARMPLLRAMYPNCKIVVPIRRPEDQIASLMRQHVRFTAMHADDEFSLAYMSGIGHFEFGAAFKPIDFAGWLDAVDIAESDHVRFWMKYWLAAYAPLAAIDDVIFFDYDSACDNGPAHIEALAGAIGVPYSAPVKAAAQRLRPASKRHAFPDDAGESLIADVEDLYQCLRRRCISPPPANGPATASS
jgi:hypothetical protein